MPTAKKLTIETVNLDDDREMDQWNLLVWRSWPVENEFDHQVIAAGMERVRAEIKELQEKGLLDAQGTVLKVLPRD